MRVKITEMYEDLTPVYDLEGNEHSKVVDVTPEEYKKMLDEYPLIESYIGKNCEIRGGEMDRIQYKFEVIDDELTPFGMNDVEYLREKLNDAMLTKIPRKYLYRESNVRRLKHRLDKEFEKFVKKLNNGNSETKRSIF